MEITEKRLAKQIKKVLKEQHQDYRMNLEEVKFKDMDVNKVFLCISPAYYDRFIQIIEQDCLDNFLSKLSDENADTFLKYLSNSNVMKILDCMPYFIKFCSVKKLIDVLSCQFDHNIQTLFKKIATSRIYFEFVGKYLKALQFVRKGDVIKSKEIVHCIYNYCIETVISDDELKKHKETIYKVVSEFSPEIIAILIEKDNNEILEDLIFSKFDSKKILEVIEQISDDNLDIVLTRYDYGILTRLSSSELIHYIYPKFSVSDLLNFILAMEERGTVIEKVIKVDIFYDIFALTEDVLQKKEILKTILPKYGTDSYGELYNQYLNELEKIQQLQIMAEDEALKDIIEDVLITTSSERELYLTEALILEHLKSFRENKECSKKAQEK